MKKVKRVVYDAIVIRHNKILLVEKKGIWILPGGKPKKNENCLQCLQREFKEELPCLTLKVKDFYGFFEGISPFSKNKIVVVGFFADVDGELIPDGEITKARFVRNFKKIRLSKVTSKIVSKLQKDGFLEKL